VYALRRAAVGVLFELFLFFCLYGFLLGSLLLCKYREHAFSRGLKKHSERAHLRTEPFQTLRRGVTTQKRLRKGSPVVQNTLRIGFKNARMGSEHSEQDQPVVYALCRGWLNHSDWIDHTHNALRIDW
jgi:hypothetical protein